MEDTQITQAAVDAARLYGELRTKTKEEVEEAVFRRLADINVEFIDLTTRWEMFDTHLAYFKVNGHKIKATIELMPWDKGDHTQTLKAIADRISEAVMNEMFKDRAIQSQFLK